MMSSEQIYGLSAAQARKVAKEKKVPYLVTEEDLRVWKHSLEMGHTPRLPFPNIGQYRPKGYTLVGDMLVDKTGFGSPTEPALTIGQLLHALDANKGYAIIEEGQFRIVLGEFERV